MKRVGHRFLLAAIILLTLNSVVCMAQQDDKILHLAKSKGKVYELLEMLTNKTGKMFIYDSDVIDNDKKARIDAGDYTLGQAVETIIGEKGLELKEIGDHILINKPAYIKKESVAVVKAYAGCTLLEGNVIELTTHKPLGYVSVCIKGSSIGSIANDDGYFRLVVPDSLNGRNVVFSHIGFRTQEVSAEALRQQKFTISMQEQITTLQENVVRLTNPTMLLIEMQKNLKRNYSHVPYRETAFYREGVENNDRFVKLSEGVFNIYKPPYTSAETEQVKLLKKRNFYLKNTRDSIVAKMKAGIEACMMLDLIKSSPDFLRLPNNDYNYFSTGITTIDDRTANTIYFEQKHHIYDPLYSGELFVDADNHALLGARFEINPQYVETATDMIVERKGKGISITPQKISYSLSYRQIGSRYYISYVRGDLNFKIKKRHRIFSTSRTHLWFEMATCSIDTIDVAKYDRKELISKTSIFDDTQYAYDADFWGNLNIIPMENDISESIRKIAVKVEEMLGE
jgi:hypothetical protein